MSPFKPDVPAVLARHGVPPDADAGTPLAALAGHDWQAYVEEPPADDPRRNRKTRRFRALAVRRRPDAEVAAAHPTYGAHDHRQAAGRTAEEALARVLAGVLAREG